MSSYRYRDNDSNSSSSEEDDDASTVSQDDVTRIIERTDAVAIEDEDYEEEEVSVSVSSYESDENARQVQEILSSSVVDDGDDVREVLSATVRRMR